MDYVLWKRELEKQIAALESKMCKEKQLIRRMEINAELKRERSFWLSHENKKYRAK